MNLQQSMQIINLNSYLFTDDNSLNSENIHINNYAAPFITHNFDEKDSSIEKHFENAIKEVFTPDIFPSDEISIEEIEKKMKKDKPLKAEYINKKRGRKSNNISKKTHSSKDFDNILRKIQVHFFNFITSFLNDIIYNFLGKKKFFNKFNYNDKKNIRHDFVESLKNMDIKTLIENIKISPKYKTNKNINEEKLKSLNNYSWFKTFINKNFSEIFKIYYNEKEPLNVYYINQKEIELSKDTKNFYDLLKANNSIIEEINKIAENVYLNNEKIVKFKLFNKK